MKTIKIINLLNKIAKGEEVPQKIRIGALYMYWDGSVYWDEDGESQFCEVIGSSEYSLNREVEIIEEVETLEEKEIEKLDIDKNDISWCEGNMKTDEDMVDIFLKTKDKINELIDEVNELKRGN